MRRSKTIKSLSVIIAFLVLLSGLPQAEAAVQPGPTNQIKKLTATEVLANQKKLSSNQYHYMTVKNNGSVAVWGDPFVGEPKTPANVRDVVALTSSGKMAFALKKNGMIVKWGSGDSLQSIYAGVDPAKVKDAVAISASAGTLLIVHKNGKVSYHRYRDDGGSPLTAIPKDLAGVTDISGGAYHALALKKNGTVTAWGKDYRGNTKVPKEVSHAVAIAAGSQVSAALTKDGRAIAWGSGFEKTELQTAPYRDIVGIEAGFDEVYLLRADGSIAVWKEGKVSLLPDMTKLSAMVADGEAGALGLTQDGQFVQRSSSYYGGFVPAQAASSITSVAMNDTEYVAVRTDGTLTQWSKFSSPQLKKIPAATKEIVSVSVSSNQHALAVKKDGTVIAWGNNNYGEATVPSGLRNVTAVAAGYEYSLALSQDGKVTGWGNNRLGFIEVPEGLEDVVAIAAGVPNLAMKKDGTVVAWGYKAKMMPTQTAKATAIASGGSYAAILHEDVTVTIWDEFGHSARIDTLKNEKAKPGSISFGVHSEALWVMMDNGAVIAFDAYTGKELKRYDQMAFRQVTGDIGVLTNGDIIVLDPYDFSGNSQLKNVKNAAFLYKNNELSFIVGKDKRISVQGNSYIMADAPEWADGLKKYAFSSIHALVLKENGMVEAWGGHNGVDLEGNVTRTPTASVPTGLKDIIDIAAGPDFSLALKKDGMVKAWGWSGSSVLKVPATVKNAIAITAGEYYAAALRKDGTVVEWGDVSGRSSMPKGLKDVKAIAISGQNTMALKRDGTVACWGDDCKTPASIKNAVSVTGAVGHFVIYCSDGTIIDYDTRTGVDRFYHPAKIQNVDRIFALHGATYVLKKDGTSVVWGDRLPFQIQL
ncbi:RCC1 domain-containing protein [Paenibacillus sp. NPDC057967]|uniref:RCC1 domain-containing protein n=1 Tax=Paenibacillus sp. NPDC057967 TaxID=3346293 RepID=UPI0036DDDF5D